MREERTDPSSEVSEGLLVAETFLRLLTSFFRLILLPWVSSRESSVDLLLSSLELIV